MSLAHGPAIVTSGLLLYLDAANSKSYPGSGNFWYDISGNGNNGTLVNGVAYNSGNGGNLVFDGVNDYVSVNSNLVPTNITVNAWFSISASASQRILRWRFYGYGITLTANNAIDIDVWSTVSNNIGVSSTDNYISLNQIYLATMTVGSSAISLYVNGTLINSASLAANSIYYQSDGTGLAIGTDAGGLNKFLNGKIYCTTIYNRALSATEVLQNFQALRGRYGV